ncbi:uncharacterized protein YhfF [Bacillus pakistanensis]|uniref:Uncharacterized protein YhfF n=1 Tax=Rossellomorea pakistanensis TaxID=992288 RepID=A0ABS2NK52_9BACI|nr:ASCH domain-containing protein [Bacillus pakistanensis]MBM7588253.1 uncharacterized protein YhfF [Bacillus pakistanensis]
MEHKSVTKMWENYTKISDTSNKTYNSWHFCHEKEDADHLAQLVKDGIKTATSSLHLFYELEGESLPKRGQLDIITNWEGIAQAIIETVDVRVIPFKEVNADFAYKEGEGDRSLNYWRKVHVDFFSAELAAINQSFSDEMLVVCEEFKIVYM